MKNAILFLIFSIITMGYVNAQSKKAAKLPTFTVDNFEKKAEKFVNKEIYITGTCDHVCKHAGKKLQLIGEVEGNSIEILAGKIDKFPKELEGEDLKIKAVVMEEKIDEEYLKEWEAELKSSGTACETEMGQIKDARAKMKKDKKDYVSSYYLKAVSYEKL